MHRKLLLDHARSGRQAAVLFQDLKEIIIIIRPDAKVRSGNKLRRGVLNGQRGDRF